MNNTNVESVFLDEHDLNDKMKNNRRKEKIREIVEEFFR